jgi:hypothetical protein
MPKENTTTEAPKRRRRRPTIRPGLFARAPYRGILAEIAREEGVSVAAVHYGIYRDCNPRIVSIALAKKQQREQDDAATRAALLELDYAEEAE